MALFTGKGDNGTTYKFDCSDRFSKASTIAEALGAVDEVNTFLGLVKIKVGKNSEPIVNDIENFSDDKVYEILNKIQQNLFIVQAELAGAEKFIDSKKIEEMSDIINEIEKAIPPITTF
jgi:ATP:cob(I)alamin adenosyltransferase